MSTSAADNKRMSCPGLEQLITVPAVTTGASATESANEHYPHQNGWPGSVWCALLRRVSQAAELRREIVAQDAGIYSDCSADACRLLRRESDDFCGDCLGAAPSAALSPARSAHDDIQYVSASWRR